MAFTPAGSGNVALLGVTTPFIMEEESLLISEESNTGENIHPNEKSKEEGIKSGKRTVILVIISAVIFVTVVAIFEVFRNVFNNHFANKALNDPKSHNTEEEIESTKAANRYSLTSSMYFAGFMIISAVVIIYVLINLIENKR